MMIKRLALAAAIALTTSVAPIGAALAQSDAGSEDKANAPRTDGIVVFDGLNKVTARIVELDAPIGKPTEFGALVITPRACQKAPPEEPPESAVFVEIAEHKPGEAPRQLFSGWMFASSPGLSALDHPIYDLWVVDCRFPDRGDETEAAAGEGTAAPSDN